MDAYQQYIHLSRYARYLPEEERRETWQETVDRYIGFWLGRFPQFEKELDEAREAILNLEVMPSMRCMMTAGPALERDEVAGYNCAYVAVDNVRVFDEILYILMCGTGVGFSVERQYIAKLPEVAEEFHDTETTITVRDSKIGWAAAFRELISLLYAGQRPVWDLSRIRAAGVPLKTFGGRASGPEPLDDLFRFAVRTFEGAAGRRLNSLEIHDIICKVADVVVVGGVRRSALISLSNLTDQRMRHAKDGNWYDENPQRALANNSVSYTESPDMGIYLEEWLSLFRSKSGERGFFNRGAAQLQAERTGRRDPDQEFGCNPCSEIILRSGQFCNLTEVVVRAGDTLADLRRKSRIGCFLGTLQSTLTDFRYLRKIWKDNCEEERLLGVSLTGIHDHRELSNPYNPELGPALNELRSEVVSYNKTLSKKLKINQSSATTCVKPSGTVSQLVNSASGIHARYAPYYLRRVRSDVKDPLATWLKEQGVPCEPAFRNPSVLVFTFPQKAPGGATVEGVWTALERLRLWKIYHDEWCEHKPSITLHYKDDDVPSIIHWCWENFDTVSGIAFLPKDDHAYTQAPYEAISAADYTALMETFPKNLDLSSFREVEDNTIGSQEMACTGGVCDVVDTA